MKNFNSIFLVSQPCKRKLSKVLLDKRVINDELRNQKIGTILEDFAFNKEKLNIENSLMKLHTNLNRHVNDRWEFLPTLPGKNIYLRNT